MRLQYLGKNHLHWCDQCHVPVLGKKCACGSSAREVPITPPGDARPAFPADIDHINTIYQDYFGVPLIPEGHLVILNKVPDKDRMEEIVMGGTVVGVIRYLPEKQKWEPLPRPSAALYMDPVKKVVVADDGAIPSIREKSASVLAPGLVAIEDSVRQGDEVFIVDRSGACIAVGRAKEDAQTARAMDRGAIVRTRKVKEATCIPGPATWEDAVRANEIILSNVEEEAILFIRNVMEKHPIQANVSYSGGKDSLATLLVTLRAAGPLPLLFADTGLEFEETYANVNDVANHYGLEVIRTDTAKEFWETMEREGPPAVDARWCCKVCKLLPIKRLIETEWGECLSFIGQRKYESFKRMKSPRVWRNGYVECQVSAAPIQHWTALHVWLYIFREQAPFNVLYGRRIDRIGCFMCPSSDWATFEYIIEEYPALWQTWHDALNAYKEKHGLPDIWIEQALWRKRGDKDEDDAGSYT